MEAYIPSTQIAVWFALFGIARFENQRWIRAHRRGMQGDSQAIGTFVDLTGFIALIFGIAFLISIGFQFGLWKAVGLFVISAVVGGAWSILSTLMLKGDSLIIWALGTIALWPLGIVLAMQTNWLGLFV